MKQKEPVIVKKVRRIEAPEDAGGSWKIAYADFVTAMMAFFLLMWLLGSQSQGDLKGISEYFKNPLKVTMMGGPSSGNSSNVIPGGGSNMEESYGQEQKGDEDKKRIKLAAEKALATAQKSAEEKRLGSLQKKLEDTVLHNPALKAIEDQIKVTITDDGLEIQIIDEENRPMFQGGKSKPLPHMVDILGTLAGVLNEVPNKLSITGHTDSIPFHGPGGTGNWELSSDRASASRRLMVELGLEQDKVIRVAGLADTVPIDALPSSPRNRRISIVVLNEKAEAAILRKPDPQPVSKIGDSVGITEATSPPKDEFSRPWKN